MKKSGEDRELRKVALQRVRRVAGTLEQEDMKGAVEFVGKPFPKLYNFLGKEGCARIDPLHRRNLGICLQCGNFDRFNFVCRVGNFRPRY